MITPEIARKIEELGLEKIQVRSPMTCDAPLGVCRCCYGMDMSTGNHGRRRYGGRYHRRTKHR
jgi:DNA-directed RNA polymerase subunit beta'